jgi:hypothetical protein
MVDSSGTGAEAHEEGVSFERKTAGGAWGRARPWTAGGNLEEAQAQGYLRTAAPREPSPGAVEVVEAHYHPWAAGTRLYQAEGQWYLAGAGPSDRDIGGMRGYEFLHINKATSYVLSPEGIYRIVLVNSNPQVNWIAPLSYVRN